MKSFHGSIRFLAGCLALLFLGGCGREEPPVAEVVPVLTAAEVEQHDGRLCEKRTKIPFTGEVREFYPDGILKAKASVREGRMNGPTRGYYPSGKLHTEETFVDGVSDGLRRRFHEDGAVKAVEEIQLGRLHGRYERYHTNGVLAERATYRGGEPDGLAESWDAVGQPVARVRFDSGRMIEQVFLSGEGTRTVAGHSQP